MGDWVGSLLTQSVIYRSNLMDGCVVTGEEQGTQNNEMEQLGYLRLGDRQVL